MKRTSSYTLTTAHSHHRQTAWSSKEGYMSALKDGLAHSKPGTGTGSEPSAGMKYDTPLAPTLICGACKSRPDIDGQYIM